MDRIAWIEQTLRQAFAPEHFTIEDESHLHRGHAGAASGGGRFRVTIVSQAFAGQNAVARQRAVYQALGEAMRTEIHAIALQTLTPEEWNRR